MKIITTISLLAILAISLHAQQVMVATVNSVPVYIRKSKLDDSNKSQNISNAIEGVLIVQCEKPLGPDSGTPQSLAPRRKK